MSPDKRSTVCDGVILVVFLCLMLFAINRIRLLMIWEDRVV